MMDLLQAMIQLFLLGVLQHCLVFYLNKLVDTQKHYIGLMMLGIVSMWMKILKVSTE